MLDALGLKDVNGDGWRELPDGSLFKVTLDYKANDDPNGVPMKQNEILAKNWQGVGINAKQNPITPTGWNDLWGGGKIMVDSDWGVGDGPNCLVYPQWMVPIENTRWAPLEGEFYAVIGTPAEKQQLDIDPYKRTPPRMAADAGGPIEKIWNLYNQTKVEADQLKRTQIVWQIQKIHITDGPFFTGTVANAPTIELFKQDLHNVPTREDLGPKNGYQSGFTGPWIIPSPAVYDPETYYWDNPDQHTS